MVTDCVDRCTR